MLYPITPAAELPIDLEEAKAHLRVDGSVEDGDVMLKLGAAVRAVEHYTGPLIQSTWEVSYECFVNRVLYLPARAVTAVLAVRYQPLSGAEVTLDPAGYYVDLRGASERFPGAPRLLTGPVGWPTATLRPGAGVTVRFTAGHATRDDVPQNIKEAILLDLGNLHRNRESVVMEGQVPRVLDRGVQHLLNGHVIHFSGWAHD